MAVLYVCSYIRQAQSGVTRSICHTGFAHVRPHAADSESSVDFEYVGATSGLRGDAASFQISPPVHKGNSGGPILDQAGNATGIVNSQLRVCLNCPAAAIL
jgi:hypothetical protein